MADRIIQQFELPSQMKAITSSQEHTGLTSVCLTFNACAMDEGNHIGIRSLIKEILADMYRLSGQEHLGKTITSQVMPDMISVSGCHLASQFDSYMQTISYPFANFNSYLDGVDIEHIKHKVYSDSFLKDLPWFNALECFTKQIYGDHPYALPVTGSRESLDIISKRDIEQFFAQNYVARNGAISIVGDICLETLQDSLVYDLNIPDKGIRMTDKSRYYRKPCALEKPSSLVVKNGTGGLAWVIVGYQVPDINSEDTVHGYLVQNLVDRMMYDEIRQKRKWAYHAFASYCDQVYGGHFMCVACTPVSLAENARDVMIDLLHGLKNGTISDSELFAQKQKQKGMYLWINEGLTEQAQMLSARCLIGLDPDYRVTLRKIDQVSSDDIHRFAKNYFNGNYVSVIAE
jgi:predicted Zn-dependent peptidase